MLQLNWKERCGLNILLPKCELEINLRDGFLVVFDFLGCHLFSFVCFLPCLFVCLIVFAGGPGPTGFPGSHLLREELFVRGAGLVPFSGPQVTKRSPEELQMHVYCVPGD